MTQGQAGDEEEVLFEADDVNYVNGKQHGHGDSHSGDGWMPR